ncbi:MAG: ArsR family transcriptional regulator, zinc-responsive transcriptional repressor [Mycobacteriales bacterium]|jgi:DNA-binding transcriptional ArsR family regulator
MNVFAVSNVLGVQTVQRRQLDLASELLKTLAAPVRLALLVVLSSGERCVHELVDELGVSQPLVSQHLRVLRAARLVEAERRGREVVYRLVDEHVAEIVEGAIRHSEEERK